jgi:hypothetical protein
MAGKDEAKGKVDTADKAEVASSSEKASNGDSKPKIPRILSGEDNEAKQQRLKRFGLPVVSYLFPIFTLNSII